MTNQRTLFINDTTYDAALVREHRKSVIELRDAALKSNAFDWAISLSVTIALLDGLATILEEPKAS